MKHHKFNNDFMNILFDKLAKESKPSVILGDFNLNLIKCTQNREVNQFIEKIYLTISSSYSSSNKSHRKIRHFD